MTVADAVGVVGGAGAGVPRIEVRADHHDLVLDGVVGAGNLGDHVVGVAIALVERRLDLDGQLHRDLLLQHPRDQVVVLGREDDRRHRVGALIAAGDEQRAVLADVRLDRHGDALRLQHREPLGVQLRRTGGTRIGRFQIAAGRRTIGANRVLLDRAGEQDRALQFSCLRLHRRVFEARHPDRRGDDASGGRRRPALRISDQRHVARLDHLDRDLVERPAAAELTRLGVDVAQAHAPSSAPASTRSRACAPASS